jgi:benzoyl-CoA-dihydrodiol lyase
MLMGTRAGDNRPPAAIVLGRASFGPYPMGNGLTRRRRVFSENPHIDRAQEKSAR